MYNVDSVSSYLNINDIFLLSKSHDELILLIHYKAKRIRNDIIKLNSPTASVNENPNIAKLNNSDLNDGFLDVALTKLPNIIPAPIAAPVKPIVDKPAPINLYDSYIILCLPSDF